MHFAPPVQVHPPAAWTLALPSPAICMPCNHPWSFIRGGGGLWPRPLMEPHQCRSPRHDCIPAFLTGDQWELCDS